MQAGWYSQLAGVESAFGDAALAVWHEDSTRSMLPEIGPFDLDFNVEMMVPSCRVHVRQGPCRGTNCCPCSPHLEAVQLSLSPYVSGTSQVTIPPPETK